MSGTGTYHKHIPQPYRIQKRLALNQCFKRIHRELPPTRALGYVTFGGEDLYDVMDLAGVFDLREVGLNIISYEQDLGVARKSRDCAVARTLSKVKSVKIIIVPAEFPSRLERIAEVRRHGPIIYYLDDTGTFAERKVEAISDLLDAGLLLPGDYLLITSCMSPRIVRQPNFMREYLARFQLLWPDSAIDLDFKARNHVEMLLSTAFDRHERAMRGEVRTTPTPTLLRKLRYQDSRAPMGLWAYKIEAAQRARVKSQNVSFDDFPTHFVLREEQDEGPDLFAELL